MTTTKIDLPTETKGVLPEVDGGTGLTSDVKGDLIVGSGSGWAAVSVGSNGQLLKADSTQTDGVLWSTQAGSVGVVIDGLSSTPSTGSKGYAQIKYPGTILGWSLLADQSGSAQITVKKSTYSGFPSTSSIVAAAPPVLSSAQKNTSSTLTGWTTAVAKDDIFEFNLDSVTTITRLVLILEIQKS